MLSNCVIGSRITLPTIARYSSLTAPTLSDVKSFAALLFKPVHEPFIAPAFQPYLPPLSPTSAPPTLYALSLASTAGSVALTGAPVCMPRTSACVLNVMYSVWKLITAVSKAL